MHLHLLTYFLIFGDLGQANPSTILQVFTFSFPTTEFALHLSNWDIFCNHDRPRSLKHHHLGDRMKVRKAAPSKGERRRKVEGGGVSTTERRRRVATFNQHSYFCNRTNLLERSRQTHDAYGVISLSTNQDEDTHDLNSSGSLSPQGVPTVPTNGTGHGDTTGIKGATRAAGTGT